MPTEKDPTTPVGKLELTIGGGKTKINPWWNMRALKKLKVEYEVKVTDVLKDVFDPDLVVPFYLVGMDARDPGKWTYDQLLDQLEFSDMLTLQASMTKIAKEYGLDVAVPMQTTSPATNGEKSGQSVS